MLRVDEETADCWLVSKDSDCKFRSISMVSHFLSTKHIDRSLTFSLANSLISSPPINHGGRTSMTRGLYHGSSLFTRTKVPQQSTSSLAGREIPPLEKSRRPSYRAFEEATELGITWNANSRELKRRMCRAVRTVRRSYGVAFIFDQLGRLVAVFL